MQTRIILFYGTIAGLINCLGWLLFGTILKNEQDTFVSQETLGYIAMMVSLLLIYFGVKKIRDEHYDGIIPFKKAFSTGISIALIASVIYVIGWEVYYPFIKDDFEKQYTEESLSQKDDMSAEEYERQKQEFSQWMTYYENPFIRTGITFMEIFPLGIIMSLLCGFLLQKSKHTS